MLFAVVIATHSYGQRTYLEQNFSAPGRYTSTSPNATQFDTIYAQGSATLRLVPSQGYVEFERSSASGGGSGRIVRSTDFSPIPSTMHYQVRVTVPQTSSMTTNVATFNVGQNLSPSNNALPLDQNIFAKFSIGFLSGGNGYYFRRTGANTVNSDFQSGSVLLTWVMNNLSDPLTYITPLGTAETIAPKSFDLWVDNVRFLRNSPRVSGGEVVMSDISFRFSDGVGIIRLTDFRIREVDGVLPVQLTYFNAQAIGDRVDLNWETAWERNSREFVVERSNDLKEFGAIGRVAAAGEADGKRQYTFTDATPLPGTNYYRLRAVDKDDTFEYSKVRDVVVRPDQPVLLLAGNPTSGERIRFRALSIDPAALKLSTVLGQDINFRLDQNSDGYTEMIPHSALAPGSVHSFGRAGWLSAVHSRYLCSNLPKYLISLVPTGWLQYWGNSKIQRCEERKVGHLGGHHYAVGCGLRPYPTQQNQAGQRLVHRVRGHTAHGQRGSQSPAANQCQR